MTMGDKDLDNDLVTRRRFGGWRNIFALRLSGVCANILNIFAVGGYDDTDEPLNSETPL